MTPPRTTDPGAPDPVLIVEPPEAGLRVDRFLQRRLPGLGRREAARLCGEGGLWLERQGASPTPAPKGLTLAAGDRLRLGPGALPVLDAEITSASDAAPLPALVPGVRVEHQDDQVLVLAKPAGLPTHPLRSGETGTVANHIAALFPPPADLGGPAREAGLVHRLDTLTSGLLVAARTPVAYADLRRQFQEHRVDKAYLALVLGSPPDTLRVDLPIESRRGRRKVTLGRGQPAETFVRVLTRYDGLALVEARTRFGRRHQVRAHLASAGHPLLGDPLYAPPSTGRHPPYRPADPWPLLFASFLGFAHPADGRRLELRLPLPDEVQAALAALPTASSER